MSLYLQRSSFWTTACIFDRGLEDRGKMLGKDLDCSPEVFHPGSPQVILGMEVLWHMCMLLWGECLKVALLPHDLGLALLLKVSKLVMASRQKFISCSHNSPEWVLMSVGGSPQWREFRDSTQLLPTASLTSSGLLHASEGTRKNTEEARSPSWIF